MVPKKRRASLENDKCNELYMSECEIPFYAFNAGATSIRPLYTMNQSLYILLTLAMLNFFSSWLKTILAKKSISTVIYSIITESWHWKVLSEKSRPKSKYAALALANAKPLQTSGQAATIIHGNLHNWIWDTESLNDNAIFLAQIAPIRALSKTMDWQ